ncbi:VOC family protein [Streptomyces griseoaurantiacus]|uniref:VOC family protein n=1 Tax=Streptomyces griseoaurantiacus TaxID=68213 RepID=UPI0030E40295
MLAALDHVQLAAPPGSEDRLRAYYSGVLGMTEVPKPPVLAARGGCWFEAGTLRLHLGIEEDFRPARKAHPGLRVTGIAAYAARLAARGAPVAWDDTLPGHRRFYSEDPVGNRLEFLEPTAPGPSPLAANAPHASVDTTTGNQP